VDLSAALSIEPTTSRRRSDRASQSLVGSRCLSCRTPSWPGRAICHQCGSADLDEETFSHTGTLITHTLVHVPRPGLSTPYMLGQIQLDTGGPLVFGQVIGLPADAPVPTAVRSVIGEPTAQPWYWFAAATPADA
jgi:uncharacterized OB-fold protein